jgi:hypothetical protein
MIVLFVTATKALQFRNLGSHIVVVMVAVSLLLLLPADTEILLLQMLKKE